MRVCAEQTFFFFLISQGKGGGSLFWIVIYLHCYYGQLQLTFYLVLGLVFMWRTSWFRNVTMASYD